MPRKRRGFRRLHADRLIRCRHIDVHQIKQKRDLLDGICPEAVELLKDKHVSASALRELRRVKPVRQIEMAELMCASNARSVGYVKCLIAATPSEQLVDPESPKDARGLSADDVARIEHEMETLGKEFKIIEETHGKNTLNLVVVIGYLKRLTDNPRIARYLSQNHEELVEEFRKLVEARTTSASNVGS